MCLFFNCKHIIHALLKVSPTFSAIRVRNSLLFDFPQGHPAHDTLGISRAVSKKNTVEPIRRISERTIKKVDFKHVDISFPSKIWPMLFMSGLKFSFQALPLSPHLPLLQPGMSSLGWIFSHGRCITLAWTNQAFHWRPGIGLDDQLLGRSDLYFRNIHQKIAYE